MRKLSVLCAQIAFVLLFVLIITPSAYAQTGCTQQSQTSLLSQFSDSAPTGSIRPSSVRNIICTNAIAHTTTELRSFSLTQYPQGVIRTAVATAGDAPPIAFAPDTKNVCSSDDGGYCVAASGGGFWLAQLSGPEDIREWPNVIADGNTDSAPGINAACSAYNNIFIPTTILPFEIKSPLTCVSGNITGGLSSLINPSPGYSFPGQGWLECSSSVTICTTWGTSSVTNPLSVSNITVSRSGASVASGTINIKILNGYAITLNNVHSINADTCIYIQGFGSTSSNLTINNSSVDRCQSHWWVFDQWNIVTLTGGIDGVGATPNGGPEYTNASDVYLFTGTTGGSSYQGPNTIIISDHNYQNSAGGAACLFNWANFVSGYNAGIAGSLIKITDNHFEQHGFTGTAQGTFCSDGSLSLISNVHLTGNSFTMGSTSFGFFSFNSATALANWHIIGNELGGCGNVTLSPTPVSGPALSGIQFIGNTGCASASFTSNGVGANDFFSAGNSWAQLTVAGLFHQFTSIGDIYGTNLTNTATGHVVIINPLTGLTTVGAGAASKYVCVDANGLLLTQAAAC